MTTKVKKSRMAEVFKVIFSGLFGVILTILYQHFLNPPQSFAFIYNGNEVLVTETEYVELVEENNSLKNNWKQCRLSFHLSKLNRRIKSLLKQ